MRDLRIAAGFVGDARRSSGSRILAKPRASIAGAARAGAKAGAILRSPGGIPGHLEAVFGQVKCSPGQARAVD
jgi:hypothetical protein